MVAALLLLIPVLSFKLCIEFVKLKQKGRLSRAGYVALDRLIKPSSLTLK